MKHFCRAVPSTADIVRQGIKWLAGRPRLAKARDAWWWRHMCAALAALNITGEATMSSVQRNP